VAFQSQNSALTSGSAAYTNKVGKICLKILSLVGSILIKPRVKKYNIQSNAYLGISLTSLAIKYYCCPFSF